jgi:hypothetical protein
MKVAFVANSHGNLDLLESFLLMLVSKHGVDEVVTVGGAGYDAAAVLRTRLQRYPVEVPWTDPSYADFVLASISQGVVEAPADEVAHTRALQQALRAETGELVVGALKVAVQGEGSPGDDIGLRVVDEGEGRRLTRGDVSELCPGQLRGMLWDGEPASCAVLEEAGDKVRVRFIDLDGQDLDEPQNL